MLDAIVEECRLGSETDLGGVIVDDGWQTLDRNRGDAFSGDWKHESIPDMKGFVDRVHALNQKFIPWFSVPMAGEQSEARKTFFQSDDNVHFSAAGSALMAQQVAVCILKNLGRERDHGGSAKKTALNTDFESKP